MREILPLRRRAETLDFNLANGKFRATLGFYPDGRLGEVFINSPKVGTDVDVAIKDAAILLSFALQHGAKLEDIRPAMTRSASGQPEGAIGALLDLIAR